MSALIRLLIFFYIKIIIIDNLRSDIKHYQFFSYDLNSLSLSINLFAFKKSSFISTEKLFPFIIVVLTFKPISIALNNSTPSILSNLVCLLLQNFANALGLNDIMDKCFK